MRALRSHYNNSLEVIMATAVLHNISVLWKEPLPENNHPDLDNVIPPEFRNDRVGQVQVIDAVNDRAAVRGEGEIVRDRIRANMPPPSRRESRLMNRFRNQ